MVSRSQGMAVVQEAKNSGEWMYSQGQEGEAAVSYADRVGDCTDYVRNGVQEGLGDAWSGGAKASTRMFWNGQAAGFTEVEAAAAQPGDIVVSGPGEHAGVFTGVNSKGEIRALANNGSPTSSKSGYRDGDTKVTTFAPGSRFYRPLSGQIP